MDLTTIYTILSGAFMLYMGVRWSTCTFLDQTIKTFLWAMVLFCAFLLLNTFGYIVQT